ncbi:hypothetical protein EJ110_NYTH10821 [Nymphaea thermarum]|nr:hypothetical protein EJ110_NYTH10821 [Nymphaea thermarum]
MDAVELPLPADVVVSKILAKDGFTRRLVDIEEPAMRFQVAGDSSGFGGLSFAGTSSSSGAKAKCASRCSTSKLVSRTGKNNDVNVRGIASASTCQDHSEQHPCEETNNVLPSASVVSMKKIHRKAEKLPTSSSPAVKKPRIGGIEDSPCPAGADGKNSI